MLRDWEGDGVAEGQRETEFEEDEVKEGVSEGEGVALGHCELLPL